jgi:hypothetical protein
MALMSGTTMQAIARLVAADGDAAQDVIHALNREVLTLGGRWPSRHITDADTAVIVKKAAARPQLGLPFTHCSYLSSRLHAGPLGCATQDVSLKSAVRLVLVSMNVPTKVSVPGPVSRPRL